ncbi:hypothetical protein XU18_2551 [Perkinsela sp. CCAP 1560/4]|nr:hypothetical protein XU18_4133 [Perkinsela sp. CCAP 1560/4]KNH06650.1 hypothetical protein XU18_2551 [Perkinsela sp. CCAP 1560/4]|eukprot:KNH04645.1 hypothetical protein XU18_4133 [Perkinsela sp. CCAP 1560/4]
MTPNTAIPQSEVNAAIERFNSGWGARRDCADIYEIFKELNDYLHSCTLETDKAVSSQSRDDLIVKWNTTMSVLYSNFVSRSLQSRRIVQVPPQIRDSSANELSEKLVPRETADMNSRAPAVKTPSTEMALRDYKKFLEESLRRYEALLSQQKCDFERLSLKK